MDTLQSTYRSVTIAAIHTVAPGVKLFTIFAEGGLSFVLGQFITLVFPRAGREYRRSYSICSGPGEPVAFAVKRIENGMFSRALVDSAKLGDVLYTTGAAGLFVLPADISAYRQVFFFAAGIGITPMLSLIKSVLRQPNGPAVGLIFSNSSPRDVAFYTELQMLAGEHPQRFRIEYLYSNAYNAARARLSKALVPLLLSEYAAAPLSEALFYICGPLAYMRMTIFALQENGVRDDQIKKENFVIEHRPQIYAPPDSDTHNVTVLQKGLSHTFAVVYPDSILTAAEKSGLTLPYSCRAGYCGSCAALCRSGKVWMAYNDALTDTETLHGALLTCVAHPLHGNVVVEV